MRRSQVLLWSLLCAAAPVSCGGGDGGSANDSGDAAPSEAAGVDIPDFFIPAPPGARTVLPLSETQLVIHYPVDDYDRIVEFYDAWTASQPEDFRRLSDPSAPGVQWSNDAADGGIRTIVVAPDVDITSVVLTAQ